MPRRALRPCRGVPNVRGRRGLARLRRGLRAPRGGGDGGQDRHSGHRAQPGDAHPAADVRPAPDRERPQGDDHRRQRAPRARPPLRRAARERRPDRCGTRRGRFEPGHRGQSRCLHPLRPVRARLRRHPGQRRDRPLGQGLHQPHRLRPQRSDGRVDLRHLRRMRRRLPDGRARQQADPQRPHPAAQRAEERRHGVPVLRRGLRADLSRRRGAQRDRVRRGTRPAGLAAAPVRQGPLRLGLRRLASAAHHAADPPRRQLPQGPAVRGRARRGQGPPQAGRAGRLRRGHAALTARPVGRRRSTSSPSG